MNDLSDEFHPGVGSAASKLAKLQCLQWVEATRRSSVLQDFLTGPQRECQNGERRISPSRCREKGASRYIQIGNSMHPSPLVRDALRWIISHPRRSHVMVAADWMRTHERVSDPLS